MYPGKPSIAFEFPVYQLIYLFHCSTDPYHVLFPSSSSSILVHSRFHILLASIMAWLLCILHQSTYIIPRPSHCRTGASEGCPTGLLQARQVPGHSRGLTTDSRVSHDRHPVPLDLLVQGRREHWHVTRLRHHKDQRDVLPEGAQGSARARRKIHVQGYEPWRRSFLQCSAHCHM